MQAEAPSPNTGLHRRVQRIWIFLENEEPTPLDGCKIEIEDTFAKYIFLFVEPFFARFASKFKKCSY
jgi:hypothetical protein